jgi:hypothetical protein
MPEPSFPDDREVDPIAALLPRLLDASVSSRGIKLADSTSRSWSEWVPLPMKWYDPLFLYAWVEFSIVPLIHTFSSLCFYRDWVRLCEPFQSWLI